MQNLQAILASSRPEICPLRGWSDSVFFPHLHKLIGRYTTEAEAVAHRGGGLKPCAELRGATGRSSSWPCKKLESNGIQVMYSIIQIQQIKLFLASGYNLESICNVDCDCDCDYVLNLCLSSNCGTAVRVHWRQSAVQHGVWVMSALARHMQLMCEARQGVCAYFNNRTLPTTAPPAPAPATCVLRAVPRVWVRVCACVRASVCRVACATCLWCIVYCAWCQIKY